MPTAWAITEVSRQPFLPADQACSHSTCASGPLHFPRGHRVSSPLRGLGHWAACQSHKAHGGPCPGSWPVLSAPPGAAPPPGSHADQRVGDAAATTTVVLAGPGRGDGDAAVLPAPGAAPAAAPPAADAADASGCGPGSLQPLPQGPGQVPVGPLARGALLVGEGERRWLPWVHAQLGLAGLAGCVGCDSRDWEAGT